jgi:geranylgeranyl diphosphate synthase type II
MFDLAVTKEFSLKLQQWKQIINNRLFKVLGSQEPSILYEPIKYVLEGDGKRIRPILLLLSCRSVGGQVDACLDAAVAVELLHNFTLVHDDIMDQDDTRRGRPTVHKKWNSDIALLAGDGLVALAYQSLLRTQSPRMAEIATLFTNGITELCEGQALDLEFETRADVGLDEYLTMIEKKTASLLSISAKIGVMIGDGDEAEVEALGNFGKNLGRAFQIQDDLLDITAEEDILGKTFGSDVKRHKQTYLLVHALTQADENTKKNLNSFLSKTTIAKADIIEIRSLFERIGSIKAAMEAVRKYIFSAQQNLNQIRESQAKDDLSDLLNYVWSRNA